MSEMLTSSKVYKLRGQLKDVCQSARTQDDTRVLCGR